MKRKRGAPLGNQNNFKHGFYSRQFTRQESRDLSKPSIGALQDEIILFKVIIDRVARLLKPGVRTGLSFHETVLTLHVVTLAISRLNSFYRTSRILSPEADDGVVEFMRNLGYTEQQIREEIFSLSLDSDIPDQTNSPIPGDPSPFPLDGFYASTFQPDESHRIARLDRSDLDDEIALLRILIKRTLISLHAAGAGSSHPNLSHSLIFLDTLHAYRVIIYAASCLERLERTRAFVFHRKRPSVGLLSLALKQVWAELALEHPGLSAAPPADQPFSPN